jgi:hypothetical protein
MIPLNKYFDIIKKQGATGVLAMWLWYTHTEVQDLKVRLYDCYGKGQTSSVTKPIADTTNFAVIPKDELNDIE